jgi:type I restriction-modification system DNA methylase subunit/restriction endonuclease S subunit
MEQFLGEKITYIAESDVNAALRFVRHNPDATQRAVWNLFIQQKFFTNNDFSFIDVHNEKLFYQNADVLLKILQMWQDIRLAAPDAHNQFLGDMFEFFLDQGVKQTEGQFFTPGPICRFLLMCLPLEAMVKKNAVPPKAIDFACGAGHFLTELAKQLRPLVERHHPAARVDDYHAAILGVEKEYRLSKIAKVSAFMYGQPRIKICYGDALVSEHEAYPEIADGTFDLLVANPPFSVKGFLETLPDRERERYTLTATIKDLDSSNSIETFFLERARQLLRPGGLAAIILPSSILSNGGGTYVAARALLLRSFDIVAIAEFGSGTFGRTGTNTVALFLRRKAIGPETAAHYEERVAEWFKGTDNDKRRQIAYKDAPLLDRYAAHIGIPSPDFKTLLCGAPNAALLAHETFLAYRRTFDGSTETKGLATKGWFKKLTDAEKQAELVKRFLAYVQATERDKLLHFVLADQQPGPVLIMRCPTDTKEQKRFLGYEWSGAKGDEGIKLFKDAAGRHLTPLYDEADRDNPAKINHAIAQNFLGKLTTVPAELEKHLSLVPLAELLDFSRPDFEKQIALAAKKIVTVPSKWPLEAMGTAVEVLIGGTPARENRAFYEGSNPWVSIAEMRGQVITDTKEKITDAAVAKSNVKLIPKGTTLLSFKLSIGKTAIAGCDLYTNEAIAGLIPRDRNTLLDAFLFHLFHAKFIDLSGSGYKAFGKSLNSAFLRDDVKIPLPPLDLQRTIVAECEAVDAEAAKAQADIEQAQQEMETAISSVAGAKHPTKRLEQICKIQRGRFTHRPRNDPKFFGGPYPFLQTGDVVHAINSKVAYTQTLNEEGLKVSKLFQPPVVLVTIAANIGDTAVLDYPACFTDSVVGLIPDSTINSRFLELMMRTHKEELNASAPQMAQKNINIEILRPIRVPVPPLKEQERFVKAVEALESKIATARALLRAAPARKEAILKKHL